MNVEGHPIEILSIDTARSADPATEGDPLCLFTFRPHPQRNCMDTWVLLLTLEQSLRIHDAIAKFMDDPDSWLYLTEEQREEMKT